MSIGCSAVLIDVIMCVNYSGAASHQSLAANWPQIEKTEANKLHTIVHMFVATVMSCSQPIYHKLERELLIMSCDILLIPAGVYSELLHSNPMRKFSMLHHGFSVWCGRHLV